MRRWRRIDAFVVLVALSAPGAARANGAFPDSQTILTPADRPQEILLVTNFGLVRSTDGGQTWLWSCEQDSNALGAFYQLTPLPRNRLFTVANQNVAYSDNDSCGWQIAGGSVTGYSITDAFMDPVSGTRMLAIGVAAQVYSLFQSTDSGATFAPLYQAAAGQIMTGVEIARSDASIVYIALRSSGGAPLLGRSTDGGAHFTINDLSADLGSGVLRIIAVDPQDPNRVLLRFLSPNQSIALTVDGGMTASKPVTVNGDFNSFVRLPSGTILVGGVVDFSTTPGLFRSRDRGTTFEQLAAPPAIRALSQRAGLVYAAADNFGDGYAIGTSADEGTTWQGLMTYADVKAINPCLKVQCQDICAMEVGFSLWPAEVCTADPPASTGTAGSGGGGSGAAGQGGRGGGGAAGQSGQAGQAGSGASGGAGGASGATGGGKPPPAKHGGCDVGASPGVTPGAFSILLLLAVACRRRRTTPTS